MELYFFSGPTLDFMAPSKQTGEMILSALLHAGDIDFDDYSDFTVTNIRVAVEGLFDD